MKREWHHLAAVREGNVMRLYIDGAEVASGSTTANSLATNGHDVTLARLSPTNSSRYFGGALDDVAIFNRALTADEVDSLYTQGLGMFDQRGVFRPQGGRPDIGAFEFVPEGVVGRHIFYNDSTFDANSAAANAADDNAIATDKSVLLPGEIASVEHYSSYLHGVNGIILDVANGAGVTSTDFAFHVGNDDNTGSWAVLSTPPTVTIQPFRRTTSIHGYSTTNCWMP